MKRVEPLTWYVTGLALIATPLATFLTLKSYRSELGRPITAIAALAIALVVAELLPIVIKRGTKTYAITISGTFSFALILIAPIWIALVSQTAALIIDEYRQKPNYQRLVFNFSQYTLTFGMTGITFNLITNNPWYAHSLLPPEQLPAVGVAAFTYFVTNRLLFGVVQSLTQRTPFTMVILNNIQVEMLTVAVELGMAPLAVSTVDYTPLLLPLLILPIAAAHKSANLAAMREYEALHDSLTGLPNREMLLKSFNSESAQTNQTRALIFFDLDHFKEINDTLGHHLGDLLLKQVANRMLSLVPPHATVARFGGDEFAILVPLTLGDTRTEALQVASQMMDALVEPFNADGIRIDVQASIGIALTPEHGTDFTLLMSRADIALYDAKEERSKCMIYDPLKDQHTPGRLSLLGELRDGLNRDELELRYQPKVALGTNTVVGVEALARWRHPTQGLLGPQVFIPMAENTGLIGPMTLIIIEKALVQARRWMDVGWTLSVAVNLSVRHLTDTELPRQVQMALQKHGVPAHLLTLEVTESTIMKDPARSQGVLEELRALGIRISVDDYGTGYSSLAYLQQLQIDELKIDRSFVQSLSEEGGNEVIVRSTIELGHNLGLQVVAEGVEDVDAWRRLADLKCDMVQGFLLSPPVPAGELTRWLQDRRVAHDHPTGSTDVITLERHP